MTEGAKVAARGAILSIPAALAVTYWAGRLFPSIVAWLLGFALFLLTGIKCLLLTPVKPGVAQPHHYKEFYVPALLLQSQHSCGSSGLSGCSLGRVNDRMTYWTSEANSHLPAGTSLDDAQRFFETHGLHLRCCVSGPPGAARYYYATERKVGRFFFTEYDVAVLVALTPARSVESVRVERWGVGL